MPDIEGTYERCRRRYPTVDLPVAQFVERVTEILAGQVALDQIHIEDLFLALACAAGNRVAWEYFADDFVPLLRHFARSACRNLSESEDVAQELVASLLADKEKLATYNGRGSLANWLRVAASHAAVDRFRKDRKQVSLEELQEHGQEVQHSGSTPHSSQPERLDARWGPVLSKILEDEIRQLPARDRLLLMLYYLHGVSLKAIGRQFEVHEATISRRLEGLRKQIRKRIERELRRRHGLRPQEIQSLWHWAAEQDTFSLKSVSVND